VEKADTRVRGRGKRGEGGGERKWHLAAVEATSALALSLPVVPLARVKTGRIVNFGKVVRSMT
jgi:hypothetical protein